jgi:hypothetical protein
VVFSASSDISSPDQDEMVSEEIAEITEHKRIAPAEMTLASQARKHASPVNFYEKCIQRINQMLNKNFIKDGKVTYASSDKSTHLVLLNSKEHSGYGGPSFWYGFRPNQNEFLKETKSSYIAFGCGREDAIILIPFSEFEKFVPHMVASHRDGELTHHHVLIAKSCSQFTLRLNQQMVDISKYVL